VTNAIILIFIFASLDSSVVTSRTTSANESLLFLYSVRNTREGYKVNTRRADWDSGKSILSAAECTCAKTRGEAQGRLTHLSMSVFAPCDLRHQHSSR